MALAESSGSVREAQQLSTENSRLQRENDALAAAVEQLTTQRDSQKRQLATLEREQRKAGARLRLPQAFGGAAAVPVHIDCRREGLVILGTDVAGGRAARRTCPRRMIARERSTFLELVGRVRGRKLAPSRQVIVFWIRPEGIESATKAIKIARNAGAPIGWEPAGTDWEF